MLGYTGHFYVSGFGRHDWTQKGRWDCAMENGTLIRVLVGLQGRAIGKVSDGVANSPSRRLMFDIRTRGPKFGQRLFKTTNMYDSRAHINATCSTWE